jgi:hypothetical protein
MLSVYSCLMVKCDLTECRTVKEKKTLAKPWGFPYRCRWAVWVWTSRQKIGSLNTCRGCPPRPKAWERPGSSKELKHFNIPTLASKDNNPPKNNYQSSNAHTVLGIITYPFVINKKLIKKQYKSIYSMIMKY